jgi:hypothetical protein
LQGGDGDGERPRQSGTMSQWRYSPVFNSHLNKRFPMSSHQFSAPSNTSNWLPLGSFIYQDLINYIPLHHVIGKSCRYLRNFELAAKVFRQKADRRTVLGLPKAKFANLNDNRKNCSTGS